MKEHSAGAGSDMFLHVQAKRAGKIKGEARQLGHEDDIIVRGWRWSVSQASALGSTQALSRRSYSALTVIKGIDHATTGLMAALATNDEIKEARLSMRKAGGEQEVYFVIRLEGARTVTTAPPPRGAGVGTAARTRSAGSRAPPRHRRRCSRRPPRSRDRGWARSGPCTPRDHRRRSSRSGRSGTRW